MSEPVKERIVQCDVAVIGGGAAGLLAATLCAEQRMRVVLASAGPPATSLATGAVDVLGRDDAVEVDLGEYLRSLPPEHPYRQAEEAAPGALVGGVEAFKRIMARQGLPYRGRPDRTTKALARGGLEATGLLPEPTALAPVYGSKAVLGIRGVTADAATTGKGLAEAAPLQRHRILDLSVKSRLLAQAETPEQVARALDEEHVFDRLVKDLRRGLRGRAPEGVLMPPLFDRDTLHRMQNLREELGLPVEEVLTPLGAGGVRLHQALRTAARAAGVQLLEPARAAEVRIAAPQMESLLLETQPVPLRLMGDHFILASGQRLPGSGPEPWGALEWAEGQPPRLSTVGLRPYVPGPPRRALSNVWGIGSTLGGLPGRHGTGLGPALASAWAAFRGIQAAG